MTVDRARLLALAFLVGVLGVLAPGCYADWAFVRDARLQVEPRLQQQVKAQADEIQKLKAQLKAGDSK